MDKLNIYNIFPKISKILNLKLIIIQIKNLKITIKFLITKLMIYKDN